MNWTRMLYGPNYKIIGVPVTLTVAGVVYPMRAIEMTDGVDLGGMVAVETTRPIAAVMYQSLVDNSLTIDEINAGCILTMNGVSRSVTSTKPMPSSGGEIDGEVYLLLQV